jgi:AcrR family transcriptional regulator
MRRRILDATRTALASFGPRKIALSDVARIAGVSRPTLYRYFASKDALLEGLAEYDHQRFDDGMTAAQRGLEGEARVDAVLCFIVQFQHDDPAHLLVVIEPGFVLEQLAIRLDVMRGRLRKLFDDAGDAPDPRADDLADVVVRTALSHFLIPSADPARLLRELRTVVFGSAPVGSAPAGAVTVP